MKVTCRPSVSHLRRAAGPDGPIVRKRQDVVDMYERPPVNNPNTGQQQTARGAWSVASAAWRELSPEQKADWNRYGRSGPLYRERESVEPLNGYRLFQSAAGNLQILGLGLPTRVPEQRPPEMPRKVELLPAAEGDTLRLRVEHGLRADGFRVVVSMSPATLRSSRKADRRNGRHVRGWGAASTAPLPESGGEIVLTGCRYTVAPGQRFGVWIRVVRTTDGMSSAEMALDFVRPEAAVPQAAIAPIGLRGPTKTSGPGGAGTVAPTADTGAGARLSIVASRPATVSVRRPHHRHRQKAG